VVGKPNPNAFLTAAKGAIDAAEEEGVYRPDVLHP
jgi:hypothetical protein